MLAVKSQVHEVRSAELSLGGPLVPHLTNRRFTLIVKYNGQESLDPLTGSRIREMVYTFSAISARKILRMANDKNARRTTILSRLNSENVQIRIRKISNRIILIFGDNEYQCHVLASEFKRMCNNGRVRRISSHL